MGDVVPVLAACLIVHHLMNHVYIADTDELCGGGGGGVDPDTGKAHGFYRTLLPHL